MRDDLPATSKPLSRRRFLHLGAAATGGAMLGIATADSAKAATAKVAKQTVNYQATPKGPARCGTCSFFQAPSSCNYVNGPITPTGWCVLYQAKS
jgi:anaerobic selenocysteine-containing dehydrogenase